MLVAKNQKGLKELSISEDIINDILSNDTKVIVGYGSNGKGKSTIKDLLTIDNLEKNFELQEENQLNLLKNSFKNANYMVFDNSYINKFIYTEDKFHQNQTKIILKTDQIQKLYESKNSINENITKIINISKKYEDIIKNYIDKFNYKTASGSVSKPKRRYATTFIKGKLPYKYDDLFTIPDDSHKRWWYEGLSIYDKNKLDYCPWCKNEIANFSVNIKNQIDSVEDTTVIDSKLFTDKVEKISDFAIIMNNTETSDNVKGIINDILNLINSSLDMNVENEIFEKIDMLINHLENDKKIFEELIYKIKTLDNITETIDIKLTNKIKEIKFFKINYELECLSELIDEFVLYINEVEENIKQSNIELHNLINNSEEDLNRILYNLGLKYCIEINRTNVLTNGINDVDNYIVLKSKNNIDISNKINTTLSYGEKNTLAFAYFIEQIKNCADLNTIVLFDDPISSYDLFRRYTSLGLLNEINFNDYKKMIILTHESNFVSSIVSCYKKIQSVNCLILNETDEGKIEINNLEPNYISELNLYKNIIDFSHDFSISQRVLAIRKLYELYRHITGNEKLNLYGYICKLVHYRKDDKAKWDNSYIDEIKILYDFYGVKYDSSIESIKDETIVFGDIDCLYNKLIKKNIYDITPEEIICLRMISESAIRNDSSDTKRFKEQNLMRIKNSNKLNNLSVFMELLNAMTHSDEEEIWPELSLNDIRSIPRIIISQIIDIIK